MRIIEGFRLRTIAGEHYILGEGIKQIGFRQNVKLNDAGKDVWNRLEGKEFNAKDIAVILQERYGVEEKKSYQFAEEIISQWKQIPIIEE